MRSSKTIWPSVDGAGTSNGCFRVSRAGGQAEEEYYKVKETCTFVVHPRKTAFLLFTSTLLWTQRKQKTCFHCGSVGHLAKYCKDQRGEGAQESGEDNAGKVYVPPRRHKFDSEQDRTAFAQRVRAFKYQSRKSDR